MSCKPHEPTDTTRAEVAALSTYGITQSEIARYMSLDPKTLRKWYRDELDNSSVKAHAQVGKFLYTAASGRALKDGATHSDCLRAAMFWAKTQMGWRETETPRETQPIHIEIINPNAPNKPD